MEISTSTRRIQRSIEYPTKNLMIAIAMTVIALCALAAALSFSFHSARYTENYAIPMREMQFELIYHNSRLSDTALYFALTKDDIWQQRYDAATMAVDRSLQSAIALSRNVNVTRLLVLASRLNSELEAMRRTAFELTKKGQQDAALASLYGSDYLLRQTAYSTHLRSITEAMNTYRLTQLAWEQQLIIATLALAAAIGFTVLPYSWIRVIRAHIDWRRALDEDNRARTEAEEKLAGAYKELSRDLEVAKELQLRQLPTATRLNNVCFSWLFQPAKHIGGDTFGYFNINDNHVCFYVLDVSGHGVASSLLAFNAQHQIVASAGKAAALLTHLNGDANALVVQMVSEYNKTFISANDSSVYYTLIYAVLNVQTGLVSMVQAGHPSPIHLDMASRRTSLLGNGGLPVGILPNAEFECVTVKLSKGDRLFLYSDGITECMNAEQQEFGQERLESMVLLQAHTPLPDVPTVISKIIVAWHGREGSFDDDITFLAVEID